jgi:beta-mannosidase
MFEQWKLNDFNPGEGLARKAFSQDFDDSQWLPVAVPGDVHRALIAAGRIPDPFYDRNELQCRWMEEREWWYRLTFAVDQAPLAADEVWQLVFHGLDTYATVWLNGHLLGSHANMFREAVFNVSQVLRPGQANTLAVRFDPPLSHVDPHSAFHSWGPNPERVFMRKAQFGYGWDWGPRLPTIGIWRPVELRRVQQARISGVNFYTIALDREQDWALVGVVVEAQRYTGARPLAAHLALKRPNEFYEEYFPLEPAGDGYRASAFIRIPHPQLWWTHDLGEPALYDLELELSAGDVVVDKWLQPVGIRTIALDQSPDPEEPGTRFFRFVLNGEPLFARGADWIPADSFVGAIPAGRYQTLLESASQANMNMLRVWGGGIYEIGEFYRLCDRLGLLVWQDFMFACAMYPDHDPSFVAEVEAEARYQVNRLRHHACLALWCGNNECQSIHSNRTWDKPDERVPGWTLYHELLPRLVAQIDGHTPYWPGSPFGGSDHNSMEDGDRHNWQVWHGELPRRFGVKPRHDHSPEGVSYIRYAEERGRFISEFGMHAAPQLETLRRVIPAGLLYHQSLAMNNHNKDEPKNKGDRLMKAVTGAPRDLKSYIDYSMLAQAEGLKFGIEHFRRRKPHCSGALFWQLNDCWPGLSWSVLDYYGNGKAGYYYAKRAYAPVLASFRPVDDGSIELWITNDTLQPLSGQAQVRLRRFSGEVLWESEPGFAQPANCSGIVRRWPAREIKKDLDCYLSVSSAEDLFPANRHFFGMFKDLRRDPVQPELTLTSLDEHSLRAGLTAGAFAYFVHLSSTEDNTRFNDNYFDLQPGEAKEILIENRAAILTPDKISLGWL